MNKFGKPDEEDYETVCEVIEKMVDNAAGLVSARAQRTHHNSYIAGPPSAAVTENQNYPTTVTFGNQNSGFQAGVINGGVSGLNFGGR
jgi:hypothetical protein